MKTSDYTYPLPAEKIALYPLSERDASKLLVYVGGKITHSQFRSLPEFLPPGALLVFNNTRVIPARIHFRKTTGAIIEIFLLNPLAPSVVLAETMLATRTCTWHCTIGNLKKWPDGSVLRQETSIGPIAATLLDRVQGIVEFSWAGDATFSEVLGATGETPLPPYIKRKAEATDRERYQTVYSNQDGAVAAPTAGLHFTPAVFSKLEDRGIAVDFLTLHVSAGTFQPIKTDMPEEHVMHEEQVVVTRENLENLLVPERFVVAVGTTSMRTLESLYWFGARLLSGRGAKFRIEQNDPNTVPGTPAAREAIAAVLRHLDERNLDRLVGTTSIYIRPGYRFRICQGLITNFHQPASTLILLVAAFVGNDWRAVYQEALQKDYRFLSYGDSSLLLPNVPAN